MNKVGYIYIMTNESFSGHDWVKIGYSDNVELRRRQLSSTGLPYDYEIYATYELPEGVKIADKALHLLIQKLNANLRLNRNREFFEIKPEDAVAILKALAVIHGREDKVVLYKDNKPLKSDLEKVEESEKAISPPRKELKSDLVFYLEKKKLGLKAKMVIENGKFKVSAGSDASELKRSALSGAHNSIADLRKRLIEEGTIQKNKFVKDYVFDSCSAAAAQITGTTMRGPTEWKDEKGIELAKYLAGE